MESSLKFRASHSSELLGLGSVQEDLKLDASQKLKAIKLTVEVVEAGRPLIDGDYRKKASEFLQPAQLERLDQIAMQAKFFSDAPNTLLNSATAEKLSLTVSQKEWLQGLAEQSKAERNRMLMDHDFRGIQRKGIEILEQQRIAATATLTAEQKIELEKLHGKFFDFAAEYRLPEATVFRRQ